MAIRRALESPSPNRMTESMNAEFFKDAAKCPNGGWAEQQRKLAVFFSVWLSAHRSVSDVWAEWLEEWIRGEEGAGRWRIGALFSTV